MGAAMGAAMAHCFIRVHQTPSRPLLRPSACHLVFPSTHSSARPSISAHVDFAVDVFVDVFVDVAVDVADSLAWPFLHSSPTSYFDPANLRWRRRVKAIRIKFVRVAATSRELLETIGNVNTFVEPVLDAWRGVMEHQSVDEILRTVVSDLAEDAAGGLVGTHTALL